MTNFTGSGGADIANAGTGTLSGFVGGSVADLQDAVGDQFFCGAGNDIVTVTNGASNRIVGSGGADTMRGGSGNDTFNFNPGDVVAGEFADGGGGSDTLLVQAAVTGTVDFGVAEIRSMEEMVFLGVNGTTLTAAFEARQFGVGEVSSSLSISGNAELGAHYVVQVEMGTTATLNLAAFTFGPTWGNDDAVEVFGDNDDEHITGTEKRDLLLGSGGDDVLTGGGDVDTLRGGTGNDRLDGGTGADVLVGGAGNDIFIVDDAGDGITESLLLGGVDTVKSSVLSLDLANYANVENAALLGSAALSLKGYAGENVLTGNDGDNTIGGLGGNDRLSGGGGADRLDGNSGADRLTGGAGADLFIVATAADSTPATAGRDVVVDFSHGQGDRIDLRNIDADAGATGNQAFRFIGAATFSHDAGELRVVAQNGNLFLHGDIDGDGVSDVSVQVNGLASLQAGDILL